NGYMVEAFNSAKQFIGQLSPALSGCVIMDLQMPEMNGLELQEALSRFENPLPVIFLTAQGDIPTTVKAMRGGAEDFLTKLASKEKLLGAVERALERGARERQDRERF